MLDFDLYNYVHELKAMLERTDGIDNSGFIRHMLYRDDSNQVKVHIYKEDNHPRPHIHIYYKSEHSISLCIKSGKVLAGNMPRKYLKPILGWQAKHKSFLLKQWEAVQSGSKPIKFST